MRRGRGGVGGSVLEGREVRSLQAYVWLAGNTEWILGVVRINPVIVVSISFPCQLAIGKLIETKHEQPRAFASMKALHLKQAAYFEY